MSAPSQVDLLRVLIDRAEQDGGFAIEVRQWIADHLVPLKILGPWQADPEDPVRASDLRAPLAANRGAAALCSCFHVGGDLQEPWRGEYCGTAADGVSPVQYPTAALARRHADAGAKANGWVLADRPLEQLAQRLLQLGEYPPAVEDMLERTHPFKALAGHYETYGHDPVVRDCLMQLGFLPQPDASWLTEIELCHPGAAHSYRGALSIADVLQNMSLHELPLFAWAERFYLRVASGITGHKTVEGHQVPVVTLHTTVPLAGARVLAAGGGE